MSGHLPSLKRYSLVVREVRASLLNKALQTTTVFELIGGYLRDSSETLVGLIDHVESYLCVVVMDFGSAVEGTESTAQYFNRGVTNKKQKGVREHFRLLGGDR